MTADNDIWAVVPVKDTAAAKTRLAPALQPDLRRALFLAMLAALPAASSSPPTRPQSSSPAAMAPNACKMVPMPAIPARLPPRRGVSPSKGGQAC